MTDKLREAAADALDSLEYVQRHFPNLSGWGLRRDRIISLRAALAEPQAGPQPVEVPCQRCHFPNGCKAHGSCRIEYEAARRLGLQPVEVPEMTRVRVQHLFDTHVGESKSQPWTVHDFFIFARAIIAERDAMWRDALHKQKG